VALLASRMAKYQVVSREAVASSSEDGITVSPAFARSDPTSRTIRFRLLRTIGGLNVATTAYARAPLAEPLPLEDRVRQRAHELYVLRGKESGFSELDDWLQAEQEILLAQDQLRNEE